MLTPVRGVSQEHKGTLSENSSSGRSLRPPVAGRRTLPGWRQVSIFRRAPLRVANERHAGHFARKVSGYCFVQNGF